MRVQEIPGILYNKCSEHYGRGRESTYFWPIPYRVRALNIQDAGERYIGAIGYSEEGEWFVVWQREPEKGNSLKLRPLVEISTKVTLQDVWDICHERKAPQRVTISFLAQPLPYPLAKGRLIPEVLTRAYELLTQCEVGDSRT